MMRVRHGGRLTGLLKVAALAVATLAVLVLLGSGYPEKLFPSFSSSSGDPSSAGVIDWDVTWSPDSRRIAFNRSDYGSPDETTAGQSDVFVASADGHRLAQLTRTPVDETVLGWLSEPPRIVFARHEGLRRPVTIHALDLRGGAPRLLGQVDAADLLVVLSHDARQALVVSPWADPADYALLDLARKTRRLLPGSASDWQDGAWSPDDSRLAYVANGSIVILRGGRVERRIPLGEYDSASGGLAWSPDGRRLVYGSSWGDASSLWLVELSDGSRSRLTGGTDVTDREPVWSADGYIYYEHGSYEADDGLWAITPDGGVKRKVTDNDWGSFFDDLFSNGKNDRWLEQATPSPDGTRIAYLLGERGAWKNWSLGGVMNSDGSDKTPFRATQPQEGSTS